MNVLVTVMQKRKNNTKASYLITTIIILIYLQNIKEYQVQKSLSKKNQLRILIIISSNQLYMILYNNRIIILYILINCKKIKRTKKWILFFEILKLFNKKINLLNLKILMVFSHFQNLNFLKIYQKIQQIIRF